MQVVLIGTYDLTGGAPARLESVSGRPVHFLALGAKTDIPAELAHRVEFTDKLEDGSAVSPAFSAANA